MKPAGESKAGAIENRCERIKKTLIRAVRHSRSIFKRIDNIPVKTLHIIKKGAGFSGPGQNIRIPQFLDFLIRGLHDGQSIVRTIMEHIVATEVKIDNRPRTAITILLGTGPGLPKIL